MALLYLFSKYEFIHDKLTQGSRPKYGYTPFAETFQQNAPLSETI